MDTGQAKVQMMTFMYFPVHEGTAALQRPSLVSVLILATKDARVLFVVAVGVDSCRVFLVKNASL